MLRGAALIAWLAEPLPGLAQDNIVATATLPRDLSPCGMFLNAEPVVQSVLIGLVFTSIVTWTVWLAKTIEILFGKRRVRATLNKLAHVRSTTEGIRRLADAQGEVSAARSACRRVASKSGFTTASEIVRNFTTHDLVADDLGRPEQFGLLSMASFDRL